MDSMMTAHQVAELLGVHENWVYDQAVSGELPSYKIGGTRRFDPDELRGWIAEHREPANGRQPPRQSKAITIVAAAAHREAHDQERQSELAPSTHVSRRSGEAAVASDDEPQPRLFEI